jgi:hypothetical protein
MALIHQGRRPGNYRGVKPEVLLAAISACIPPERMIFQGLSGPPDMASWNAEKEFIVKEFRQMDIFGQCLAYGLPAAMFVYAIFEACCEQTGAAYILFLFSGGIGMLALFLPILLYVRRFFRVRLAVLGAWREKLSEDA